MAAVISWSVIALVAIVLGLAALDIVVAAVSMLVGALLAWFEPLFDRLPRVHVPHLHFPGPRRHGPLVG